MPYGEGGADGHVKRVFCSLLRDFKAEVGGIDNLLCHPVHFMPGDDSLSA